MWSQHSIGSDGMIHSLIMANLDRSRFGVHAAANRGSRFETTTAVASLQALPDVHVRPTSFGPSLNFRSWWSRLRDAIVTGPRAVASLIGLVIYARRRGIKIVHCTEKPRDAFYGYLVSRAAGAKCVIHLHVKVNHEWMLPLTTWAMRRADGLIGVSDYIRQTAIDSGYRPERCYALVNAIDASRWDPETDGSAVRAELGIAPDDVVLSIISRVYSWKGHTELLQALAKVAPEFGDFRLLLVGVDDLRAQPGHKSYMAELRELTHELGLENHVIFTGFRTDIPQVMAATDIYTMPSFEEPCAVAFLEALAMSVPVIALDSGGTAQLVDHERSGLLSKPYDIDELAANILRLLRDPELRASMGRHGRERVLEYYTPARIARDAEVVYQDILAAKPAPAATGADPLRAPG
jgi:glycosyltransferase involved in cell wall biosynthesis